MIKALENIEDKSKFEQEIISLILRANTENLEKLRVAYPELVKRSLNNSIFNRKIVL